MTTETASTTSDPFAVQLGYLQQVMTAQAGDLTQSESLFQPEGECNCVNWIVGHIVVSRNEMLEMVGKPTVWKQDEGARYARGQEPIKGPSEGVLELSRLLEVYEASQAPLLEALAAMSEEDLAVKVPWFGDEIDKAGALAGFLFHEAYHMGQVGLFRRLLGKPSGLGA